MATSSEVRGWWRGYYRNQSRMVRVGFPGQDRVWSLLVADKSAPVWEAVAQIMESEPYLFLETAGGTYHPREDGSTSLHPYGLALDLNPRKNPHKVPLTTDMPASFIARMEGIKANGKKALTWGGRWKKPDAMHYQINVAPADCKNVTWDKGEPPVPVPPPTNGDDEPVTDAEIEKIAQRAADLTWAKLMSIPDQGTKAAGWVLPQTYIGVTRAITAAENAAKGTDAILKKLDQ